MAKKVKGLKVSKDLQEKFKFKNDGTSILGDSTDSSHEMKGTGSVSGSMEVEGSVTLRERLSGFLFSPPHIDASIETTMVQHFVDNAESDYEGFLVYVTNPAAQEPFNLANKFYFCESGTWHPSPFSGEIVNYAPNLNPTYEISVPAQGTDSIPFSLDLPADLFQDQDGDALVYTATLQGGGPLPAWLSFDVTSTILSGTPSESDVGLLNVLITATDPSNASGTTTQEIQILAKPTPFWQGATNSFGTSGPEDWATVLPSNLLSLNPISGGSSAWHKITAPDEFNVFSKTVSIDFSLADWYNSSGAGSSNNMITVGLQCTMPSATTDFAEFYINDNGGGKYLTPRINHKNGLVNNYSGGSWSYDPYDPPEDISNMEDFDFRIEIGRAAKHHSWNAYYVPILVLAKRRTSHQDLIDAGLENISFQDIRTSSEFQQLYYDLGNSYPKVNKHFFRAQYSMLIHMGAYDVDDLKFSPYVKSVQRSPSDTTTPVAIFDKFDITVDESPVEDVNIPFGDFTVEEGQPITITVPSDLFVDPEGETPLVYGTRRTSYQAIPNWLSFDENTGVYTGTPGADDVGAYEIAVWGMDDASESAGDISNPQASYSRSFTLTVTEASPTEANPLLPIWTDLDNAPVSGLTNPAHGGAFVTQPDGGLDGSPTSWSSYTSAHTFYARADNDIIDLADAGTDKQLVMEYSFDSPTDACHNYMAIGLEGTNGHTQNWTMQYMVGTYDKQIWLKQNGTDKTAFHNLPFLNNSTEDITSFMFRIVMTPTHWWSNGNIRIAKVHFLGMRKNPEPGIPVLSWTELRDGMLPAWSYYPHYINYESQLGFTENASLPNVEFFPSLSVKSESNSTFSLENVKIFFEDKD
jgi:hypothetical protein